MLNGHVEEMHTGPKHREGLRAREGSRREVRRGERALFQASFKAQFISGVIQPSLTFIGNLNYVAIAVVGGMRVARATLTLGDVQAFIQYSRQFTWPITQLANIANVMQSAVASAERVFELLDEAEEEPGTSHPIVLTGPRATSSFEDVSFRYKRTAAHRRTQPRVQPGETSRSSGPPVRARRRWSTCCCASTRSTRDGSPSTGSTPAR